MDRVLSAPTSAAFNDTELLDSPGAALPCVVTTSRTIDADIVEPRHEPVHCFPFPSSAEGRWRRGRYRLDDGDHRRGDLRRARVEKSTSWNGRCWIVARVTPKEIDSPGRSSGWVRGAIRRAHS
jgi:hypothetical protein